MRLEKLFLENQQMAYNTQEIIRVLENEKNNWAIVYDSDSIRLEIEPGTDNFNTLTEILYPHLMKTPPPQGFHDVDEFGSDDGPFRFEILVYDELDEGSCPDGICAEINASVYDKVDDVLSFHATIIDASQIITYLGNIYKTLVKRPKQS